MRTVRIVSLVSLFLLLNLSGYCQDSLKRWTVKANILHVFNKTFRFDVERRVFKNQSISISPSIYSGTVHHQSDSSKINGYGVDVFYKFYVENTEMSGVYLALGGGYSYLDYSYRELGWGSFKDSDDLQYLGYRRVEKHTIVNRTNLSFLIGDQQFLSKSIVFDFYIGVGLNKSRYSGTGQRRYDRNQLDLGYTGPVPKMGFCIGFGF